LLKNNSFWEKTIDDKHRLIICPGRNFLSPRRWWHPFFDSAICNRNTYLLCDILWNCGPKHIFMLSICRHNDLGECHLRLRWRECTKGPSWTLRCWYTKSSVCVVRSRRLPQSLEQPG